MGTKYPSSKLNVDSVIGEYRITENLPKGRGGFAYVYKVKGKVSTGKELAMKLSRYGEKDPRYGNAIRFEADLLQKLKHPGIVNVLPIEGSRQDEYSQRAIEVEGSPWFYIMEFLRGGTLLSYLGKDGSLPPKVACVVCLRVAKSLLYMHQQGYAHQDVKPENIVLRDHLRRGADIQPVLVDFGVASDTSGVESKGNSILTTAPEIAAILRGEMAPEVSKTLDRTKIDAWALGVVLYRSVAGCYPFNHRTDSGLTTKILTETAVPPSEYQPNIPQEVELLLADCLDKSPERRMSIADIILRLEKITKGNTRVEEDLVQCAGNELKF